MLLYKISIAWHLIVVKCNFQKSIATVERNFSLVVLKLRSQSFACSGWSNRALLYEEGSSSLQFFTQMWAAHKHKTDEERHFHQTWQKGHWGSMFHLTIRNVQHQPSLCVTEVYHMTERQCLPGALQSVWDVRQGNQKKNVYVGKKVGYNSFEGYRKNIAQEVSCHLFSSGKRWPPELVTSPSYRLHWMSWSKTRFKPYMKTKAESVKCCVRSHLTSTNLSLITPRESSREHPVNVGWGKRVKLSDMFLRLERLERQNQWARKLQRHKTITGANINAPSRGKCAGHRQYLSLRGGCSPDHSLVFWKPRWVQVLSLQPLPPAADQIHWYEGTSHVSPAQVRGNNHIEHLLDPETTFRLALKSLLQHSCVKENRADAVQSTKAATRDVMSFSIMEPAD